MMKALADPTVFEGFTKSELTTIHSAAHSRQLMKGYTVVSENANRSLILTGSITLCLDSSGDGTAVEPFGPGKWLPDRTADHQLPLLFVARETTTILELTPAA